MTLNNIRPCPLCGNNLGILAFPFATKFNNNIYYYYKCNYCCSVIVDPIPDDETFKQMYSKTNYHDCHYEGKESAEYLISAQQLTKFLPLGSTVLDYGCGIGSFLKTLKEVGFIPFGVEFDKDVAGEAARAGGCMTMSVDDFHGQPINSKFDAIHLGDVLEHLPDPARTVKELLCFLKPDGILYVEGPLETNASPVYWAAIIFGKIKRILRPNSMGNQPPTHLFLTSEKRQRIFFGRIDNGLDLSYWKVYETGWPYANGGMLKRTISQFARIIGGKKLFGGTFGNRFRGIFIYRKSLSAVE